MENTYYLIVTLSQKSIDNLDTVQETREFRGNEAENERTPSKKAPR